RAGDVGRGGPDGAVPGARPPAPAGPRHARRGAGMTERPLTPTPDEPSIDLAVLAADDRLLDDLGHGGPAPNGDPVAALLAAWRADLDDDSGSAPPADLNDGSGSAPPADADLTRLV